MHIYIGIEDLVANALIELVEKSHRREVSFQELNQYGAMVLKFLNSSNEQAVLIMSKESTTHFLNDYSDYFELFSADGEEGVRLKEMVSVEDLWRKFRGYLSVDVMLAFMNEDSVAALGVAA